MAANSAIGSRLFTPFWSASLGEAPFLFAISVVPPDGPPIHHVIPAGPSRIANVPLTVPDGATVDVSAVDRLGNLSDPVSLDVGDPGAVARP